MRFSFCFVSQRFLILFSYCITEAIKAVVDSGCDFVTQDRIDKGGQIPGALWHIYQAKDADTIRDFLNKVHFISYLYTSFWSNLTIFVFSNLGGDR